jgi:cytochrome b561
MSTPARYHPLLVLLHWLTALLVFAALSMGILLKNLPNTPEKIGLLSLHMAAGLAILILMTVRLVVRLRTPKPVPATTGIALLDWIGRLVHGLLYLAVFGMAVSGLGIAQQAGLGQVVLGSAGTLPQDFYAFPPRLGHGYLSLALMALVGLHVAAWLYHQFIRRDNLIARMWFGK